MIHGIGSEIPLRGAFAILIILFHGPSQLQGKYSNLNTIADFTRARYTHARAGERVPV